MITTWLIYLGLGSCAGLLAGLLGVGGGIVIVPMLVFMFTWQKLPAHYIQHLALGTSLATIVFTSLSSVRAHHAHRAVNWQVFRLITPGIVAGTLFGSWIAAQLSTPILKIFFIIFTYYVAAQMILDIRPKPTRQLPGLAGFSIVGGGIGVISSLVGIGGGSMSVPFLTWCNVKMHNAIGTSAAIGFPIALSGAIGYQFNGLSARDLPPYCSGFVYLPALIGIAAASFCTAPLGARLAHRLPVSKLKKIFAMLLLIIGTKMLSGLLTG
jgi:uncharacterized membrane protein YfcA